MGLAHRAITPLPSRHHLGPLLAMCPSTSPQREPSIPSPACAGRAALRQGDGVASEFVFFALLKSVLCSAKITILQLGRERFPRSIDLGSGARRPRSS